jgi:hypothetical protein
LAAAFVLILGRAGFIFVVSPVRPTVSLDSVNDIVPSEANQTEIKPDIRHEEIV